MGERGNIVIEKDDQLFTAPVFFYTHWNGYQLKPILQSALKRGKNRWDDPSYLARIIFSEMIKGDVLSETGAGISTVITDNSYPLLCVNMKEKMVRERESKEPSGPASKEWSFEDFITTTFEKEESEY